MRETIANFFVKAAKYVLLFLIIMLAFSMFFGTVHLTLIWFEKLLSPDPLMFVFNINEMFEIYEKILIIVVGYEVLKSIYIIITSNKIPVMEILKIAVIAISNKIITLDLHKTDYNSMIAIACILISIGGTYFLFNRFKPNDADI
ncbi:MAG: phosphate-starvation-inducible PsiE family protein [Chlorobiaceae bacterium]|jgi:uncharacterized membrane protein (DUF373 family)|nr:phosphate-starvation-inducible PsiE family protein [Chlorobiaceae bacterium]